MMNPSDRRLLQDLVNWYRQNKGQVSTRQPDYNPARLITRQGVKIGKTDASVAPDATVTVSIWRDGADTTENVEDVQYDWMTSGTISSGKEVVITYFADEGIWRITGAECE